MRYRLQRHDGTDCSATMVPITVLRMVPIQRYRHLFCTFDKNGRSHDGFLVRRVYNPPLYNFCHYRSCHKEQACQQEQQMFFHGRLIFEYLKRFVFASQS